MKFLAMVLLLLQSLSSFASINIEDYMEHIKGDYKLVLPAAQVVFADEIFFSLKEDGVVSVDETLGADGASQTVSFDNPIGPVSVPITVVMLNIYSDEECDTYNLQLTVEGDSNDTIQPLFQGLTFSVNDGPGEYVYVERIQNAKLYKMNKNKVFELVKSI